MSVAVAIKEQNRILVGTDSKAIRGGTRQSMFNDHNFKVFRVPGVEDCIMAVVGDFRTANILKVEDDLIPAFDLFSKEINYDYMVTSLVPKLMSVLEEYNLIIKDGNRNRLPSDIILAYKDKLFQITMDGCVIEIDDYCAVGTGASEAIGSLLSTEKLNSEERVKKAICASVVNDLFVDYPIVLANTKDEEVKVFTEADIKSRSNSNTKKNN